MTLPSSLAEFCLLLDVQMEKRDETLADHLATLQYLLDENVDRGADPLLAFQNVQQLLRGDLEDFLYQVIYEELERKESRYAGELLEGFCRYVKERKWFAFLWALKEIQEEPEGGFELLEQVVEESKGDFDLDFFFEIFHFLSRQGTHDYFVEIAATLLPEIRREEEFREFLQITAGHYHALSLHSLAKGVEKILAEREGTPGKLTQTDPALAEIKAILHQKLSL